MKTSLILLTMLLTIGCPAADIYLCGDSTMCNYSKKHAPREGWGMRLQQFCLPGVKVKNFASAGATTRSIRVTHKLWDPLLNNLKPGDFVIIQFGHNDQKPNNPQRPNHVHCGLKDLYPENLTMFIREVREKNAFPVLATPICRRIFKDGQWYDPTNPTLREYSEAVLAVAARENVPVVDMNRLTTEKVINSGEQESKKFYNILEPGESPNYPDGSNDLTHLNTTGAEIFAELFVGDAKKQELPIAELFIED